MIKKSHIKIYAALPLILGTSYVSAAQFNWDGPGQLTLDNVATYGTTYRVNPQDESNDGINSNDGNRNFDVGFVSQTLSLRTELDLNFDNVGFFARTSINKDFALQGDTNYGKEDFHKEDPQPSQVGERGTKDDNQFNDETKNLLGQNFELLDAYFYGYTDIGDMTLSGKLGRHIIYWGETLFYRNGIGDINAVDAGRLKLPGVSVKDVILPAATLSGNLSLTYNLSMEAFYTFEYRKTRMSPVGSFFSTGDMFSPGGNTAYNGTPGALKPLVPIHAGLEDAGLVSDLYFEEDYFQVASVEDDILASDDGQYGLAFRYQAEELNDTEFGFYYTNYHSKTPVISATLKSYEGLSIPDIQAAVAPGIQAQVTAAVMADDSIPAGQKAAAIGAGTTAQVTSVIGGLTALEVAANTEVNSRFLEDIQVLGMSFNTLVGETVIAGEVAYRPDYSLTVSSSDDLARDVISQTAEIASTGVIQIAGQEYDINNDDNVDNYTERDLYNFSLVGTHVFNNTLISDQFAAVVEVAGEHIEGDLTYQGYSSTEGTETRDFVSKAACSSFGDCTEDGKITRDAWGYIVALNSKWNNVFTGTILTGSLRFKQDVSGNSHRTGNFVEGTTAMTVGMGANIYKNLNTNLQYTNFNGGTNNKLRDRDNVSFTLGYSF